jgi:RNA polymerase sigma factor (sigma-70 family)
VTNLHKMATTIKTEAKKRDRFTELFTDHYPAVFNTVVLKVGSPADAEDICQEVFLALHYQLDEVQNVRAWLYGTLKNKVLQYYRKKYRSNEEIDALMNDAALAFVNGFRDTRIIIGEVIDEVAADADDRNIFDLVALHGYSYGETARLMGITKRKVDYKFNMIARKIISRLKEKGIEKIEDLL